MATEAQLRAQLSNIQDLEQASQLKVISLTGQISTANGNTKTLLLQAEIAAAKGEADVASSLTAQAKEQLALIGPLTEQRDQEQSVANSLESQKNALAEQLFEVGTGAGQVQSGSTNTGDGETPNPPTPDKLPQPDTTLTPEENGEVVTTTEETPEQISQQVTEQRSSDFGTVITSETPEVALLDLTAGQGGQKNPNLVPAKNILNNGQKAAYGSGAKDWRFRMSLAPTANYLYKANPAGILQPLQATDGVIFPYTPSINVTYSANYNAADLTHTNYKIYNYHHSAVENVSIAGDFTAQDSAEANYLLAVIHFFKSVTKMFYGQDENPSRGIPPPLVYLSGFGQYQFDRHPCVITNFTYALPVDVDYINAYPTNNSSALGGVNMQPFMPQIAKWMSPLDRLRTLTSKIQPGGLPPPPAFQRSQNINEITRVPTKINIQLTAIPIVTRNAISNQFSLKRYATGELMRGSVNPKAGGGIW